jgi:hypothetical protein
VYGLTDGVRDGLLFDVNFTAAIIDILKNGARVKGGFWQAMDAAYTFSCDGTGVSSDPALDGYFLGYLPAFFLPNMVAIGIACFLNPIRIEPK